MVTVIQKQGSVLGRLGKGFGQGLAEQVPKEIDRYRLSQGLKNFEQESDNLTPMQQFARLSSIPGITPQMIQSFSELAKQQGMRNAYNGRKGGSEASQIPKSQLDQVQFGNFQQQPNKMGQPSPREKTPPADQNEAYGQPQVNPQNPTSPEFTTRAPWSPERRDDEISRVWDQNRNATFDQVVKIAADNEAREIAQPESVQKEYQRLEGIRKQIEEEFDKQLETKLEKGTKDEVYKDVTGENLVNSKRQMEKELRNNPNASVADIANKYSNQILDLAKTKSELKKLESKIGLNEFNPFKKEKAYDKLKSYAKTFADSGNAEEFYQKLQTGSFGMSPQAAATIAFERSPSIQKVINNYKPNQSAQDSPKNSRKAAQDIAKAITFNDSIQAVAKELKDRNPFFDEGMFYDQLRSDYEDGSLKVSKRQKREIDQGASDVLPTWGDIFIMPNRKGY